MGENLDRIERIEKVLSYACKMVKRLRRAHNNVTEIFDSNFETFEKDVMRNSSNIDKIVHTLEELMGEKPEGNNIEKKENEYVKMLYQ